MTLPSVVAATPFLFLLIALNIPPNARAQEETPVDAELKKIFDDFDVDKDGILSKDETSRVLISHWYNTVWDDVDDDKDGFLSRGKEFDLFMTLSEDDVGSAYAEASFEEVDGDGDGRISVDEAKAFVLKGLETEFWDVDGLDEDEGLTVEEFLEAVGLTIDDGPDEL
eukprot:CAMPEP_0172507210 /NCGR_PEP_ID=MMETSP1066-20121228/202266_1 /TAXON_ID=671091 /ORGANISM="Coscinodiscus wailesii, Strain CCMP2513" /LENGTH=167 /DNA_ID=CAMNT_0013284681 /DNA_START=125 /DNA_END=628 /DNA_ORIENTATION=-